MGHPVSDYPYPIHISYQTYNFHFQTIIILLIYTIHRYLYNTHVHSFKFLKGEFTKYYFLIWGLPQGPRQISGVIFYSLFGAYNPTIHNTNVGEDNIYQDSIRWTLYMQKDKKYWNMKEGKKCTFIQSSISSLM